MEQTYAIITAVTASYLISGALMVHTQNATSSLLFKVAPFALGCACAFVSLKMFGVI